MKKLIKTLLVLSLITLFTLILSSCGGAKFNIYFIVDGEEYAQVEATKGKSVNMPISPEKSEHIFDGWFVDSKTWEIPFDKDFLIGKSFNSDMYVYAKWTFVHEHVTGEWITVTEASCDAEGVKIKQCTICGETVSTEPLEKPPHREIVVPGFAETDVKDGLTDGSYCAVCNTIIKEQTLIPARIQGVNIGSDLFSINGTILTTTVSNATDKINIRENLKINKRASIAIFYDSAMQSPVGDGNAALTVGANSFYVLIKNGSESATYTITIQRKAIYTVSFNTNGADTMEGVSVEGGDIITPSSPTRTGYVFEGWDHDFTLPINSSFTAAAIWSPSIDTPYTVEHYIQKNDGSFALYSEKRYTGTTDSTATALSEEILGYELIENISTLTATVLPDGSLVMTLYYKKIVFTVSFDTNCNTTIPDKSVRIDGLIEMPEPPKNGSATFMGWFYNGTLWDFSTDTVKNDMTLTAKWSCVEAHVESGLTVLKETSCTADGLKVISCLVCKELLYSERIEKLPHEQMLIPGVPATEVSDGFTDEIYCTLCGETIVERQKIPARIQGTELESDIFIKSGKVFSIFLPNPTTSIGIFENLKFNTSSSIRIYLDESLLNELSADPASLYVGDNIFYIVISAGEESETYILSVRRRPIYTVTVNYNTSTPNDVITVEEGGGVTLDTPTRAGYDFVAWDKELDLIYSDITVTALWAPKSDVKYTVEHYIENDAGGFNLFYSEKLFGTADADVFATLINLQGYVPDEDSSTIYSKLSPDSTLVLRIYYKKATITVRFDTMTDASLPTISVNPGEKISRPEEITNGGAQFIGWYCDGKLWDFENDTVTESITLTARWKYKVIFIAGNTESYQYVIGGEKAVEPPTPDVDFIFNGWYVFNTNNEWNFNTPINDNLILIAKDIPTLPEDEF